MHDDAVAQIVSKNKFGKNDPRDPSMSIEDRKEIQEEASELYLALVLIQNSDKCRFGKLQDDLENDFTKGVDNYPRTVIKSYQLLNEFKNAYIKGESTVTGSGHRVRSKEQR